MNKGFNAPRFIESFNGNLIPSSLFEYFDKLKNAGHLSHIRIPGGTVSQYYSPILGGKFMFSEGRPLIEYISDLKSLDAPVLYVANLNDSNTLSETIYAINLLQTNGIKILGVELGNELYLLKDRTGILYSFWVDRKKLSLLINDINQHHDRLKSLFPDIRTSVPISHGDGTHKIYNEAIIKGTYTDAFSYHIYVDMTKWESQLQKIKNKILSFKKEVWITEYNCQFDNPETNKDLFLSPLHLDILYNKIPNLAKEVNSPIISRHSLLGNNKVSPFFPHITIYKDGSFGIVDKII